MKRFSKIRCDSGFTLIELLIAIAVSGIVLAGLVQVFSTSNRSYTKQDEMAILQQNLRVIKMKLDQDVRMAGCGFASAFFYLGNQIYPIQFTNGGGDNGSDILRIKYVNYDDSYGALPQLTVTRISSPPEFTVSEDLSNTDSNLRYSLWGSPVFAVYTRSIPNGETNLISDVFKVTKVTKGTPPVQSTLTCEMDPDHDEWRNGFSTAVPLQGAINSINFFSATQLVTITYSLSPDPLSPAHRVLVRKEQHANIVGPIPPGDIIPDAVIAEDIIAEDIEDLQFAFGLDTNNDGVVDAAEWKNDDNLDPVEISQVRLVRISILGRSSRPLYGLEPITSTTKPWPTWPLIEDHDTGIATKEYLRQLLQFEIKPRNLK